MVGLYDFSSYLTESSSTDYGLCFAAQSVADTFYSGNGGEEVVFPGPIALPEDLFPSIHTRVPNPIKRHQNGIRIEPTHVFCFFLWLNSKGYVQTRF